MEPYWFVAAKKAPIYFSQVREDALLDLELINEYCPKSPALLMVAAGGCTTCALIGSSSLSHLHIVDPNPSQLYLTLLKIYLLKQSKKERLELLGHTAMPVLERKRRLQEIFLKLEIPDGIFGDIDDLALYGIDHVGRYERLFSALRHVLKSYANDIEELFGLDSLEAQVEKVDSQTNFGKAIDVALREVLSLEHLSALFGENATANRQKEFSCHFAERIRHLLATQKASSSPYLAQMLLGRFHEGLVYPWLTIGGINKLPDITWSKAYMQEILLSSKAESYDAIHLSNILDWLQVDVARKLLSECRRVLKPQGIVTIRQLNSTLEIPRLMPTFSWKNVEKNDRSFFYRNFYIGRKECLSPRKQPR